MRAHPLTPALLAVAALVRDRRITQEELASVVGYDPGHVSRVLSGQHPMPGTWLGSLAAAGFREAVEAEARAAGGRVVWDEVLVDDAEAARPATARALDGVTGATALAAEACAAEAPSSPGGARVVPIEAARLAEHAREQAVFWERQAAIFDRQARGGGR